ncbi:hypothetical protein [Hymenobacter cellulosivorans]|uniref:Uncharacterized protein n=1 Tax=Hymenobacter cellulosivorans TaxID=2932249 RepID=A0ABY4FCJ4_9BACT|nr:hypothetical protein [Hymenobacter cellulosivorans]UOQ53881.1 hypothetical protein MUN80_03750 [Hymenobacter cellulosivorans]
MKPTTHASPPVLAWLAMLLLSFGLNLYLLLHRTPAPTAPPPASPAQLVSNPDDDDDDTNEEDDASWVALSEELRQTRRQLAECQSHTSAPAHRIVSQ